MPQTVKLSHLERLLEDVSYPAIRDDLAVDLADVTVLLADGEVNLGELVSETNSDSFDSADDLLLELNSVMPIEAVGEPGQSEGEG
ncbi:hypothetical protein [Haloarchaeobius sp. HME9146]|uniref:DUF5789 family protein n=1 Tax=Haloarchaeobius sp. HME9146 TaxID=2978732 RepID=UPI0021C08D8F|nr:hypothetical protein [Haloarchaeobius sp. HME9146]MCT9095896.1 hypothetical protein [Haloarchaeobius sp. HME9146]